MDYRVGVWTKVPEAKALAYTECRNSRDLDTNLEYYCSVSERSLCPYADRMRNVKIEYFCWELGEEILTINQITRVVRVLEVLETEYLNFSLAIFQHWKVFENGRRTCKILEICKLKKKLILKDSEAGAARWEDSTT